MTRTHLLGTIARIGGAGPSARVGVHLCWLSRSKTIGDIYASLILIITLFQPQEPIIFEGTTKYIKSFTSKDSPFYIIHDHRQLHMVHSFNLSFPLLNQHYFNGSSLCS